MICRTRRLRPRTDCEYGFVDERPVINGIRREEVTEMRSSIRLDAEEICQARGRASPWDSFGALVKTKVPTRLHLDRAESVLPPHFSQ